MFKVDQNYIRRDRDGSIDGRLDMSNHRISGLADPTDVYDDVTRRYVASRFQALSDEVQDHKSKLDALQNLFGVKINQVLIKKYELIDTYIEKSTTMHHGGGRRIRTTFSFVKRPLIADTIEDLGGTIDEFEFVDMFTLKEYFIHLLEESADGVTWLRIKQPGTYTVHFDLIIDPNSFSSELHTRDEITHFSEHNPKHNINLEKGKKCILVHKNMPYLIRAGSKIYMYVYYNI